VKAAPRISVVIPTYQRREECKRAVESALAQEYSPLEVLVCDDHSTDGTEEDFRAWAQEEPRLRYYRLSRNQGSPAPARNLGIRNARGEWVALLDDDDRWLPGKLAVQSKFMSGGRFDVVASDAKREGGGAYLGLTSATEPSREEFLVHNPIIVSTVVGRRALLLSAGGFPKTAGGFKITGVEDYGLWLALAYRGARFVVVPEQLIVYGDADGGQMSRAVFRQEAGVAAVRWRLWRERPRDRAVLRAALRANADAARWWVRTHRGERE
jgi:glycosyltransferase involved in cell wall biosynthesis